MKIGMIQMDVAAGHMEHNIAHGFELMEEAAEHSDLVVMPELWTIGYNFHDLDKKAIQEKDSLLQKLRNLARTFGVTLIPGTLPVMKRGKIYNTAYVIGPDGEIQGSYSKRHLFHEYLESKLMEPGRGMLCTHIQGVKCGLAICFELYFPKMFRKMSQKGTTLVIVPAQWPENHMAHWNVLARARAIENGMYICAVNMAGSYHNTSAGGHSLFVDPEGFSSFEGDGKEHIYYGVYDDNKYENLARTRSVIQLEKPDWAIR